MGTAQGRERMGERENRVTLTFHMNLFGWSCWAGSCGTPREVQAWEDRASGLEVWLPVPVTSMMKRVEQALKLEFSYPHGTSVSYMVHPWDSAEWFLRIC